jgi:hypothetical protein
MAKKHKSAVFWRRKKPSTKHDIRLLRPSHLKKGKRFETWKDAHGESERSEALLGSTLEAKILANCRSGTSCDNTFCPICARRFRRRFIGELLRITENETRPVHVLTILLEAADRKAISDLDFRRHSHNLRKRLERSGLKDVLVIGGVEIVYRAKVRKWVLHINLVIIGGKSAAIRKFEKTYDSSDIERPVLTVKLKDLPEQLSYVLKFTTYHRPFAQRGGTKSRALPLNKSEHTALVQWMGQRKFTDFLFLYNARRKGSLITVSGRHRKVRS